VRKEYAVVYYSRMDEDLKTTTVLKRIKDKVISRYDGSEQLPPGVETIHIFPNEFPKELNMDLKELVKILKELKKEYPQISPGSLGNLSTDPELLNRDCIPVEEIKIDAAYIRIRVDRSIITGADIANATPEVELVGDSWCIRYTGRKPISIGERGSVQGELLAIIGTDWSALKTEERLLEEMRKRAEESYDLEQLAGTMKEINRRIGKRGTHLKLVQGNNRMRFEMITPPPHHRGTTRR